VNLTNENAADKTILSVGLVIGS